MQSGAEVSEAYAAKAAVAPEPGDASRGWQRTKRWSDSESWHLCRASLWSRWHGLAHGSWLRLALRTGDHCAVDLTSCWIGDPVGFEKEEGLCGTLHGTVSARAASTRAWERSHNHPACLSETFYDLYYCDLRLRPSTLCDLM